MKTPPLRLSPALSRRIRRTRARWWSYFKAEWTPIRHDAQPFGQFDIAIILLIAGLLVTLCLLYQIPPEGIF